jgi:hypothetical protein
VGAMMNRLFWLVLLRADIFCFVFGLLFVVVVGEGCVVAALLCA